jgi:hypothetical protein
MPAASIINCTIEALPSVQHGMTRCAMYYMHSYKLVLLRWVTACFLALWLAAMREMYAGSFLVFGLKVHARSSSSCK